MFRRLFARFLKDPYYIRNHHDPSVGRMNINRVLFTPNADLTAGPANTEAVVVEKVQKRQRRRARPENRQPK